VREAPEEKHGVGTGGEEGEGNGRRRRRRRCVHHMRTVPSLERERRAPEEVAIGDDDQDDDDDNPNNETLIKNNTTDHAIKVKNVTILIEREFYDAFVMAVQNPNSSTAATLQRVNRIASGTTVSESHTTPAGCPGYVREATA
jgi:hypothetical protein